MKIILASNSKRRQELLKQINIDYEVIVSNIDEIIFDNLTPLENCSNISYQKAIDVYKKTKGDRVIISCDTIVLFNNKVYGKPKDKQEAIDMLKLFSDNTHEVISCITVITNINNQYHEYKEHEITKVTIDLLSDFEINEWIDKNKPYDKAGGYAIQEEFGKYIKKIDGDYFNIVGLPINKLYSILKKIINN